jgi:FlaA1/EpsC-like NDP-sugar epimerase
LVDEGVQEGDVSTIVRLVGGCLAFTRYRCRVLAVGDSAAWALAIAVGAVARQDLVLADVDWTSVAWFAAGAALAQTVIGQVTGLYRGKRRIGSFDEVALLATSCASVALATLAATLAITPRPLPLGAALLGGVVALALMGSARWGWRRWVEATQRPSPDNACRLVVLGAGRAAEGVLTTMLTDSKSPYVPVALLDDDPAKANLAIRGVSVRGACDDLERVVTATHGDAVLVAIPSADRALLRDVQRRASAVGAPVLVLPPIAASFDRSVSAADVRPLDESDLLGRHTVDIDVDQIAGYLAGKAVLITGAGGSIGSELARQVARLQPAHLVLADRDESALGQVQLSLTGQGGLDAANVALCDVRDRDRMLEIFDIHRPAVVFHAAALKHVPALEQHPGEAVKTNVDGTANVLEAAQRVGVERFVNLSTDKAADPVNVLGFTKRITERLTAAATSATAGVFVSVRFGNVLASRGSMLEVFRSQAARGGPITVTHPKVNRYLMTTSEAVGLVVQAGVIGADGEVLVLDMGEPVSITELAKQVALEQDGDVPVTYTGLRRGEKLHENLFAHDEQGERRHHPLVSHVAVPALTRSQVRDAVAHADGRLPAELCRLATAGIPASRSVTELAARRASA